MEFDASSSQYFYSQINNQISNIVSFYNSTQYGNGFTITFWAKIDEAPSDTDHLVYFGKLAANVTGRNQQLGISVLNTGKLRVLVRGSHTSSSVRLNQQSTTTITDGNWHQVALTHRASDRYHVLYIDGVAEATQTPSSNNYHFLTMAVGVKRIYDGAISSTLLTGAVDELRIYNRDLSEDEILENYNSEFSIKFTRRN